ncbi:MAG TPA: hypothetical protein VK177_07200 [Flavobacteriales bacterium]|nr:hypothetical protein [Flavobacteriales bacterium]
MKSILYISFFLLSFKGFSQDTLNRTIDGKKVGWWKIYGSNKFWKGRGYDSLAVVEEGAYDKGKKRGNWTQYYPSGKLKSVIEYKSGRPSGHFKTYYENGCLEEEGTWKNNRYEGDFKRYAADSCGKLIQTKYFDPNRKPEEKPKIINSHGTSRTELIYDVKDTTRYRELNRKYNKQVEESSCKMPDPVTIRDGYAKYYDSCKNLVLDGEFKNGKLYNGKWYKYEKNGLILKVEIWKNGKYVGDGQLE